MKPTPPLIEWKNERRTYGNDKTAINRHSQRCYEFGNRDIILDKTLDAPLPFYTLMERPDCRDGKMRILPTIKVDGKEHWGDGWSWAKAERAMMTTLGAPYITRSKEVVNGVA